LGQEQSGEAAGAGAVIGVRRRARTELRGRSDAYQMDTAAGHNAPQCPPASNLRNLRIAFDSPFETKHSPMHVRRDVDFDPSKGCADFADWG